MAPDLANQAREAFVDDDFRSAVDLYTQAIDLNPRSADLYAERAQANIKLNNFTEAVADANKAIEIDPSMAQAYLRKGKGEKQQDEGSSMGMGIFDGSDDVCWPMIRSWKAELWQRGWRSVVVNGEETEGREGRGESLKGEWFVGDIGCWVVAGFGNEDSDASEIYEEEREGKDQMRLHPCGERKIAKLEEYHTAKAALEKGASLLQNDSRFSKLISECDERIAAESSDLTRSLTPEVSSIAAQSSDKSVGNLEEAEEGRSESCQRKEVEPAKPKYRHAYYQKPEEVVVTIFAKGVPAKSVSIDYGEQILSIMIDVPGEDKYHFQPRLFGKVVPDKCRFEVLSTKVEIRLVKAEAINWPSLEYSKEVAVPHVNAPPALKTPSYPSSKPRTKDWDKLAAQVKKEEKEEKLDGDAAVNKLFGDIYQSADEDMRRAMLKSFVESNGTVLSTNWQDVGSKKVEGSPPDGMELKKWEY
ncbi:hypothetical protein RHMOL_Rhmol07G0104700 [Rhododendron molle]|uniref:Uncharacterized protein n=1 Tax=Rhododendron molle TaxID=49168 RepID=A0ACC0MYZ9_RHOML|nr:hypothetical protein RHMOL_Rhmol07G0104700 [Rhododendron molle]